MTTLVDSATGDQNNHIAYKKAKAKQSYNWVLLLRSIGRTLASTTEANSSKGSCLPQVDKTKSVEPFKFLGSSVVTSPGVVKVSCLTSCRVKTQSNNVSHGVQKCSMFREPFCLPNQNGVSHIADYPGLLCYAMRDQLSHRAQNHLFRLILSLESKHSHVGPKITF